MKGSVIVNSSDGILKTVFSLLFAVLINNQFFKLEMYFITRLLGRFAPIFHLNCEHVLFVYILKQRRKKCCGCLKKIRGFSRI